MINKFLRVLRKLLNYKDTLWYAKKSSSNFCEYLRRKGIKVGEDVVFRFPQNTSIDITRPTLITIGENVDINNHFTIMTHDFSTFVFRNVYHDFVNSSGKVSIGSNIYFGTNVTILKGVMIGDNCIIGAGSLVTHSIPPNSVAAGVPCKVICSLDEYYKKRKEQQLNEAIEYAQSVIERKGELTPNDLFEEWSVFLTEADYINNPQFKKHVDWRLKQFKDSWLKGKRIVEGYEKFIELVSK